MAQNGQRTRILGLTPGSGEDKVESQTRQASGNLFIIREERDGQVTKHTYWCQLQTSGTRKNNGSEMLLKLNVSTANWMLRYSMRDICILKAVHVKKTWAFLLTTSSFWTHNVARVQLLSSKLGCPQWENQPHGSSWDSPISQLHLG